MDKSNKTIPVLLKELKDLELKLTDVYKQLGNKLLKDTADPVSTNSAGSQENLIQWQRLHDERKFCTESILDIKNNNTRLSELDSFKKQIKDRLSDTKKEAEKLKGDLLLGLYKDFLPYCGALFDPLSAEIHTEEAKIQETQEKISTLNTEKQEANFFVRLGLSGKISSYELKVKNSEKKIKNILIKSAVEVENSQEVKKLYDEDKLLPDLKKHYEEILNLRNDVTDSESRLKMIDEETDFVTQKLADVGAGKNSKKRIDSFTSRIKEIDEKIDRILESTGLKYTENFYSAEGDSLLGENPSDEKIGKYADYLKKAGNYRKEISKTKYNIEFCEVLQKIRAEENKIQNLNRTIKNSENAIKEAEKKISDSESAIKTSEVKIADLEEYASALKVKFSGKEDSTFTEEE
ncbi:MULTISPECIES: hypothetical protein [unclassified Treponema]|uniref:hypothetical protein n=1 Tax=unclassified Treponema TaxID=2638727 RepID=UPI0020A60B62|nr:MULTISPECIES: hypothetical protein [unclassified Treponema]UTC66035.1 hypothetical protein E4O06_08365 [Treponema sp. OMZ 789]UTC68765.1 hypothetical protein E4O01_08505 [Treponema sp. OMZ 790]UTC71494.1 hypothetical protein E4O02_08695 [Treponema sp. OMZ 791]